MVTDCSILFLPGNITDIELLVNDYYSYLFDNYEDLYDKAIVYEKFGKIDKAENCYNKINEFHYLLWYLVRMYNTKSFDISQGNIYDIDTYWTNWSIDCIIKNFQCNGYNIIPLLNIFGFGPTAASTQTNTEGIGGMIVEGNIAGEEFIIT